MATKKPPRQRQGDAGARQVRDGLPTVPELLRAMRLLQIPFAPEKVRALPLERQRTFLLALLGSWAEAYLYTQRAEDELEADEFHAVVAASDEIVARGDRRILLHLVQQRVERAHAAAHEAAQEPDPFSVGAPLTALLRAAGAVNEAWASPYRGGPMGELFGFLEGITNEEAGTHTVLRLPPSPELLRAARDGAAEAIGQLDAALESDGETTPVAVVEVSD